MKRKKISQPKQIPQIDTQVQPRRSLKSFDENAKKTLDIVLKCDSTGSEEAVVASLSAIQTPEVDLDRKSVV